MLTIKEEETYGQYNKHPLDLNSNPGIYSLAPKEDA